MPLIRKGFDQPIESSSSKDMQNLPVMAPEQVLKKQEENVPQWLGRNIGASALKAGSNLEGLIQLLSSPFNSLERGFHELLQPGLSQQVSQAREQVGSPAQKGFLPSLIESGTVSPEFLKTQSPFEDILQGTLSQAPFSILSGATPLGALGTSAAGNVASTGLAQLGASPLVQSLGQIGTELVSGSKGLRNSHKLESAKREVYKAAEKAKIPDQITRAGHIENALKVGADIIGKETNRSLQRDLSHIQQVLGNHLEYTNLGKDPLAKLGDLWDLKKSLNKDFPRIDEKLKPAYHNYLNGIKNALADSVAINKDFWPNISKGDQLATIERLGHEIHDRYVSSGGAIKKKIAAPLAKTIIDRPKNFIHALNKYPAAREYYFNAGIDALKNNIGSMTSNLGKLNKVLVSRSKNDSNKQHKSNNSEKELK